MKTRAMVISLIGRPNVGKSSVFNRLMRKQHKAITYDMAGVTRDRHYGITTFNDADDENPLDAILVDTGGFYPQKIDEAGKNQQEENANKFFNIMTEHAHKAIDESDLVLFVVDVREGALPFDQTIADYIRKQKKKMWLIVNKFDSESQRGDEIDFYSLGINGDEMYVTSAAHGLGIDGLREDIHKEMINFSQTSQALKSSDLQRGVTPREDVVSRLAIIGAPNAGKSTLLNLLLGSSRALVSNIAGTTVDPIDGYFDLYFGKDAKKLETSEFIKNDAALYKQYEDFQKNNPDLYTSLVSSYNLEEEVEEFEDEYEAEVDEDALGGEEGQFIDEAGDRIYEQVFGDDTQNELLEGTSSEESDEQETLEEIQEEGSYWRSLHVIDTAGIRKQKNISDFVESQSVYRSLRCITDSDICIFMIDVTKGISHQDKRLLDIAIEKGTSVIVCLNKIDLISEKIKDPQERREWLDDIRVKIPWLNYCDILPISAKQKRGIKALKRALIKTILIRRQSIATGELNRFIFELIERQPIILKGARGKRFRVKYASQIKSGPPTFLFYTNKSKGIPESYRRYLKNGLRSAFPLDNTPIHLIFRTGADLKSRMKKLNPKFF
ncbi:GTPase [Bacteriovorax sp. DB6_IX]|uniref:ribosome biogenesis GTPase Der n=1 Tax=Bacteriovorax sp. DB6_IX TaxID=1353530 RepID=UPI00040DA5FA|nr:GTPase [Bacteriovorax sp. DB6_IX]